MNRYHSSSAVNDGTRNSETRSRCLPPVHILGAGALGTVFAHRIAKARKSKTPQYQSRVHEQDDHHTRICEPRLLARPTTLDRILPTSINAEDDSPSASRSCGTVPVSVHNKSESEHSIHESTEHISIEATSTCEGQIECCIVLTKAHDAVNALLSIQHRLSDGALIVLLCNGGLAVKEEVLSSNILGQPEKRRLDVRLGMTTHGAYIESKSADLTTCRRLHAVFAGAGNIWIEEYEEHQSQVLQDLLITLEAAKLKTVGEEDGTESIYCRLWTKLAVNCFINPNSVLLDCTNGEVISSDAGSESMLAICQEVADVAAPEVKVDPAKVCEIIRNDIPRDNFSSMLQDIRHGRQTEIEYLNGWVARRGAALGINTPLNAFLAGIMRSRRNLHAAHAE